MEELIPGPAQKRTVAEGNQASLNLCSRLAQNPARAILVALSFPGAFSSR